ncbi:hypothetical protein B0H17DRAFT_1213539 [Mycena rosella]|uniref:Uncharacterized protein n=1 Tax=Mycena rosella TaxID=1033263 RepID=A0AAD7G403_MYCRO|nr:hypothetical protein B0H17DRAFT_1213539 [Mycena rosella]
MTPGNLHAARADSEATLFPALSIPIPRREHTVFPLADDDDDDDDEDGYDTRYTLNLGAGSQCASICPSACPTPSRRPSIQSLRLAPPRPAPAVPRSWEAAPLAAEPPSPTSDSSLSSGSPPPSESEDDDQTDYSHAPLPQSPRDASHPLNATMGLRGGLLSVARVLGCVVAIAVLAGSGRWDSGARL